MSDIRIRDIRGDIEEGLLKGRRYTREDISSMVEGITKGDVYAAAYGVVAYARYRLARQGIPVVTLPDRRIGIPKSKEEVRFAAERCRTSILATLYFTNVLQGYATKNSILPSSFERERVEIPTFAK